MKTIAIIGTGISGMAAGYFLKDHYDVTFYERNDYPGGHTHTIAVQEDDKPVYIDTGFIVYNEPTYPCLTRFFKELEVATMPAPMSFSVQHIPSGLEYCGTGIDGLFSQRKNLWSPRFWAMLWQMNRFNSESEEVLTNEKYEYYTVGEYVREKKFGDDFLNLFLVPMSSAVWSTPPEKIQDFPIMTLVRFFKNHGFLGLQGHLAWRTVIGGSRQYRDRVLSLFPGKVLLSAGVTEVAREAGKVAVYDSRGERKVFDACILACHADEALSILGNPTPTERWLLKDFQYQRNHAVLHTDTAVMPRNKSTWSSWNYRIHGEKDGKLHPTVIYYMNSLQKVSRRKDYFVSLNDPGLIDPQKILWKTSYEHPVFNNDTIRSQKELPKLNESGPVYFCGSYFRYGFHEDAFVSGLEVARRLREEQIWS